MSSEEKPQLSALLNAGASYALLGGIVSTFVCAFIFLNLMASEFGPPGTITRVFYEATDGYKQTRAVYIILYITITTLVAVFSGIHGVAEQEKLFERTRK